MMACMTCDLFCILLANIGYEDYTPIVLGRACCAGYKNSLSTASIVYMIGRLNDS